MIFQEIRWLLVLLLVLPIIFLGIREFLAKKETFRILDEDRAKLTRSLLSKYFLSLVFLTLVVLALSNPLILKKELIYDQTSESQIALVIDVSKSMAARKEPGIASPSRLDRVKMIIREIFPELEGSELAIYPFTDLTISQFPFSRNYELFRETLDRILVIEALPEPGSDIENALKTMASKFEKKSRLIILFSDGESTGSFAALSSSIQALKDSNIKLIVIGVGEKEGAKIPIFDKDGIFTGKYEKSKETGLSHISYLDEDYLKLIAQSSQGKYFNEKEIPSLKSFLSQGIERELITTEREITREISLWPIFLASAFVVFLVLVRFHN